MRVLPEFNQHLEEYLTPGLRSIGFIGCMPSFRRDENETIHCVWLQGTAANEGCYVNWGYHLDFIPIDDGKAVDTSRITQPACEIRGRIQLEGDLRWLYGDTSEEMEVWAKRLSSYTLDEVQKKVVALRDPESVFCSITAVDILDNTPNVQWMHQTRIRAAQWLYLINRHYGYKDRAIEIAKAAVETTTAKTHPRWFLKKELEKYQIHVDR